MYYILTRDDCTWCDKAIDLLRERKEFVQVYGYTEHPMIRRIMVKGGMKTVPQIWHDEHYIGGYNELTEYLTGPK